MPKRITQRQAIEAIRNHRDFKASALSGFNDSTGTYRVLSYSVTIARFVEGEGWTLNEHRYSVTTSRHQNMVSRAIAGTEPRRQEHPEPASRYHHDPEVGAAIDKLKKVGSFATVADIPGAYTLVQGDEAQEYGCDVGCAFVLAYEGELLHVLTIGTEVPWLDARTVEAYRAEQLG